MALQELERGWKHSTCAAGLPPQMMAPPSPAAQFLKSLRNLVMRFMQPAAHKSATPMKIFFTFAPPKAAATRAQPNQVQAHYKPPPGQAAAPQQESSRSPRMGRAPRLPAA